MSRANYAACLAVTLEYEGGYSNDPGDPGGPTKYGITIHDVRMYLKPNATAADVKNLTITEAKAIYLKHYWEPVAGDQWPDGLDLTAWDAGVNSGVGRSKTWAQETLKSALTTFEALAFTAQGLRDKVPAIQSFNAKRLSFLHGLRTWSIFGKGWGRRVAGIEAKSVSMALAAAKLSPKQIKERLGNEADKAGTASKTNAGGAAGTGTIGGGTSQFDWDVWIAVGVGIIAVLAIVYFVRWAIIHKQRADAYRAQAVAV